MNNFLSNIIKKITGTNQRQKVIIRSFLYSIVIISLFFVMMAFFINIDSINKDSKIIAKANDIDRKIIALNVKIKKGNKDMIKTNQIISNNRLFHNLNDISEFINNMSTQLEKVDYLVQFNVLKTVVDNKFGVNKIIVKFEFVNINSDGDGYRKGITALYKILKESKKKAVLKNIKIYGNLNDVGKINTTINLWSDFKYDNSKAL